MPLPSENVLLIVADYDSDGATACAVAMRALRKFGAIVDYLVPNRFEYGYGLTPEIVHLAATSSAGQPDILITVDNGIASVEGVRAANQLGIQVLITDHHLPGDQLPRCGSDRQSQSAWLQFSQQASGWRRRHFLRDACVTRGAAQAQCVRWW